jgi:hypothetical protein
MDNRIEIKSEAPSSAKELKKESLLPKAQTAKGLRLIGEECPKS